MNPLAALWIVVMLTTTSTCCCAFVTHPPFTAPLRTSNAQPIHMRFATESHHFMDNNEDVTLYTIPNTIHSAKQPPTVSMVESFGKLSVSTASVWLATVQMAMADSPDWGLFEGRIGSVLHPVTMGGMFVFSLYTAYLGFQWRRQRTMGDEISALKKLLPNLDGAPTLSAALSVAKEANDLYKINELSAALETESQIVTLTAERKALSEAGLRDKHFQQGAILAFIGTCFAIEVIFLLFVLSTRAVRRSLLFSTESLFSYFFFAIFPIQTIEPPRDH
jgi:Protein of unknown function (DUF4079)